MRRRHGNPLNLPIVEVTWFDHSTMAGWDNKHWFKAPLPECRDTGRIVWKTKDTLSLAAMVCADGDVGAVMKIPRAWVYKIRRLQCSTTRSKMGASRSTKRTT